MISIEERHKTKDFIPMEDVPTWIWDYVYNKWSDTLRTGWEPNTWKRCALCNWIDPDELNCVACSLNPCWCTGKPETSRLHITHSGGNFEVWEGTVRKFLNHIMPLCSEEIRLGDTTNAAKLLDSVPVDVWRAVYKKWENALINGWSPDLWNRCSLCEWMWQFGRYCYGCPLIADNWCNGSVNSRLHAYYYESDEEWRAGINDFLDLIESNCEYETDKHNLNWY